MSFYPVLEAGLLAADFLECGFTARIVELFEAVEAVSGDAHYLAGLGDVAEHLGQFEDAQFVLDDFVLRVHCDTSALE